MECAARDEADVEIGKADAEKAHPGDEHVALVERGDSAPETKTAAAEFRARKTIEIAADKMAAGMARERVGGQQSHVDEEHESAEAHAEAAVPAEGAHGITPKENQVHERKIEKAAMDILQNQGK